MQAIVYTEYGPPDVLRLEEVEKPVPAEGGVVLKVRAASVNALDWHFMRGRPYPMRMVAGLRAPKLTRLGVDVAGEVETIGPGVTGLKPGDAVFGTCRGAFAEYAATQPERLLPKPAALSFEEAAAVPIAGITALQALRDAGRLKPGQQVLVDGAGGGVGGFAVQIAKALGAEVTAVCGVGNLERLRALGADRVLDYAEQDFTRGGRRYDLILGANAYHSLRDYRRALAPKGIYVMTGGGGRQILEAMLLGPLLSLAGGRKLRLVGAKVKQQDLQTLKDMLDAGKLRVDIDRRYPLAQTAEAIRYMEAGHVKGKLIIAVASGGR